jgi:hypothetical protein
VEHTKFIYGRLPNDSFKESIQIYVRFNGSAGGQIGGQWH